MFVSFDDYDSYFPILFMIKTLFKGGGVHRYNFANV